MTNSRPTRRPLEVWPCQSVCAWRATGEVWPDRPGGVAVFACAGCGSEWTRAEPWTPIDASGQVPPAVAVEAAARVTSGHGAGGADSAGR